MNKKAKFSIRTEIMGLALIPLLLLASIISIYSISAFSSGLQEEVLIGLKDICYSVDAAYHALDEGDFVLDGESLKKGELNLTENEGFIDSFVGKSDVELTLFYGDTRRATSIKDASTGERILGTKASEQVTEAVVNNGKEYSTSNLVINNETYYAYYIPMKNNDGSIVGMIFAGEPTEDVELLIRNKIFGMIAITLILVILVVVFILIVANKLGNAVRETESVLHTLSKGNLNVVVHKGIKNRKDELGSMGIALEGLASTLRGIVENLKKSSEQLLVSGQEMNELAGKTSATIGEISHAMDDVSQGAVSQAEDIENATMNVGDMGDSISKIVNKVDILNGTSQKMEQAKIEADEIITELSDSSERTFEAVKRIERQVKLTDESVAKIQEAIIMISSIAEETNLLSLNASIEAARAGDSGRGFAVVAAQIQKLAEESNDSAASIKEIIENLTRESSHTVDAMNEMQEIVSEQQEKLRDTKEKFNGVSVGIQTSRDEICVIQKDSENCDEARVMVTDVIQNLSAISEENAAATEQTMASMTELNEASDVLAKKADALKVMAVELEEAMKFFEI